MENTMEQNKFSIKFKSSPNIALIKYWGKYDQNQILPINDSIGITLNSDDLSTITKCKFTKEIHKDSLLLNGQEVEITKRMKNVLNKIRQKAKQKYGQMMKEGEWQKYYFQIQSVNSFPTASGMASSASGFSCLAYALNGLFSGLLSQRQLARLARWGSGSAARAVFGGLVKWEGVNQEYLQKPKVQGLQLQKLSQKCISYNMIAACDLSYMKVMIVLTDNKQKQVSSTDGMKLSIETSQLIKLRNKIASQRILKVENLMRQINIQRQNDIDKKEQYKLFSQLAQTIIRDSNQFHAICLDTYPPIFYLNQFSKQIIYIVDNIINKETKKCKIAYSFDAGAHAFLFIHEDMIHEVLNYFYHTFSLERSELNKKGNDMLDQINNKEQTVFSSFKNKIIKPWNIWITDVGKGVEQIKQQK